MEQPIELIAGEFLEKFENAAQWWIGESPDYPRDRRIYLNVLEGDKWVLYSSPEPLIFSRKEHQMFYDKIREIMRNAGHSDDWEWIL